MKTTGNRRISLIATFATAMLAGLSGTAQANALAYAHLQVSNLTVSGAIELDPNAVLPSVLYVLSTNGNTTATLGASGVSENDSLDPLPSCQGGNCVQASTTNNNVFALSAPHVTHGDANISEDGSSGAASAELESLVNLSLNNYGSARADTNFDWAFYSGGGDLTVSFDYNALISVSLDDDVVGSYANSSLKIEVKLHLLDGDFNPITTTTWTVLNPNGNGLRGVTRTAGNAAIDPLTAELTCSGTADGQFTPGCATSQYIFQDSEALVAGYYQMEIALVSTANGQFARQITPTVPGVPEPATMALLGLGLIGLSLARRRSN